MPKPAEDLRLRPLPLLAALGTGAALAVEIVLNGELGSTTGPLPAATFSNVLSLVVMLCVAPFLPGIGEALARVRKGLRDRRLRPWHLMGGVAGGSMVLTQAAVAADLGPALYVLALVSGQTLTGLYIDHRGIGPGEVRRATRRRLVGAALTVLAVIGPVLAQADTLGTVWLAVFPLLAGAGLALQLAANGRTDEVARNAYPSVVVSFLAGAVMLAVALTFQVALQGVPRTWPDAPQYYAGGFFGVMVVLGSVLVVRYIGVLAAALGMIAGQVGGAVLLDYVLGNDPDWATAAGSVLLLVAVGLVSLNDRRDEPVEAAPAPRPGSVTAGSSHET